MHTASTAALATVLRNEVVHLEGVSRFAPSRRFASLFSDSSPSDSLYFLDSGLVKLFKRGEDGKEIILRIVAPGELFGEQALPGEEGRDIRNTSAEVLQEGVIYVIPRAVFVTWCETRPQVWRLLSETLAARQRELEKKVELLCLHDVEYRILYYLGELASLVGSRNDGLQEYSIPLSQSELASLIGATRETTSTTLNALARRGLVRLGRRLLVISSMDHVRNAVLQRTMHAAGNT
jgi:CRP/FNR family transcriptional regulator, cyclic AMP receptor protein